MAISIHCTLYCTLAAVVLSSSICVRSAPAAAAPAYSSPLFPPAACPAPAPAHSCLKQLSFSDALPPSIDSTNAMAINESTCLSVSTHLPSSGPFTIHIAEHKLLVDHPPASQLVFSLYRSLPCNMKRIFDLGIRTSCAGTADQQSILAACNNTSEEPILVYPARPPSCTAAQSGYSQSLYSYLVSLTYDESSAGALLVQAKVIYGGGLKINQTFFLHLTDFQGDEGDSYRGQDDSVGLSVSFATQGQATINLSTINMNISTYDPDPSSLSDPPPHDHKSKSSHTKAVVWVVAGVSMAIVVGLVIIALAIKKKYRARPPLVSSQRASGRTPIGGPTSTTTRAPLPHPHLESSTTPMMRTLCLSPPYHNNDFLISGSENWLKQPNPR